MSSTSKLRWGILAAGGIARTFAKGIAASTSGTLVAVASRDAERAQKFVDDVAALFPGQTITPYASYEAILADPQVQAVYIATPHTDHVRWAIAAAEAGKHILVEKPIATDAFKAGAAVEAARQHGVFLMEAFMYRAHPQMAKVREVIESGRIGSVTSIQATFSFRTIATGGQRLVNPMLAGGGILDVGCYATSFARLVAGAATGQPFAEPIALKAIAKLEENTVDGVAGQFDASAHAVAEFPGGILAQLSTGVRVNQENVARVYGTEGSIYVPSPWVPARDGGEVEVHVRDSKGLEVFKIEAGALYGMEADTVAKHLDAKESPTMSMDDTLGNMRMLDLWRQEIGLVYPFETAAHLQAPARGGKLRHAITKGVVIPKVPLKGISKPVSRLLFGMDWPKNMVEASAMLDDFYERGGNAVDTAYIYGGGKPERIFGDWMKARGVRDDMVVLCKGAHTPYCYPDALSQQLIESLDRMHITHAELYIMHRDNPAVPVGEFVDVLNEHVAAGRIGLFGGSNWSKERTDEANAYAAKHGKQGFSLLSNNLSLARMVSPVWDGCVASSEPSMREWHEKTQTPLFAWSSQARGFFTDRAHPDVKTDGELVRCWYSEDNFQRQARAKQLAKEKGCTPINIALAYVLHQAFPVFSLIGPRSLAEMTSSVAGLQVTLTPDEVAWLDLRKD
ncbi:oxidoreductase [Verrucomicrobia bacterium LW23]|nr:oxidoreductase [Verrucomicrobia bacterium LW23]